MQCKLSPSKIILFLVVQMIQHAVITISLKMGLPKAFLASITMSKGGICRFQKIERDFQQLLLKEHSKKR
jgi:hypothetical protein